MSFIRLYLILSKIYMYLSQNVRTLPPLHTFLELTYRCNLRCRFCQFIEILEKQKPHILKKAESSTIEIKDAIDQIPRSTLITLTGGEPFLRKDLYEIVKYACRRHKVHIITNGSLINDEIAGKLTDLKVRNRLCNGLFWISVSIQGCETIHDAITRIPGSYKQSVKGIEILNRHQKGSFPKINLQTVIGSSNIDQLTHIVELANNLNIGVCNFIVQNTGDHFDRGFANIQNGQANNAGTQLCEIEEDVLKKSIYAADKRARELNVKIKYQMGSMHNLIDSYIGKLKTDDFFCFAPWTTLIISADGGIRSCFNNYYGNVKSHFLSDIWLGEKFRTFRGLLQRKGSFPECSGCCMLYPKK